MGSSTKKYLVETNTSEKNRNRRKNHNQSLNAGNSPAFEKYEADWALACKKYLGSTFDDAESDLARRRKASGGKSTISQDRASRDAWDILRTRR